MPTILSRRAILASVVLAMPGVLAAQNTVFEFEGTVIESRPPGVACGVHAVAGWATVRLTRVISGQLPPGNVRVVIGCGTAPMGQNIRVRGVRISPTATHFRIYSITPTLPADGLTTFGARSLTRLP